MYIYVYICVCVCVYSTEVENEKLEWNDVFEVVIDMYR